MIRCPTCGWQLSTVLDTRAVGDDGAMIRRRRKCGACGQRFTTYESAAKPQPVVAHMTLDALRLALATAIEEVLKRFVQPHTGRR